jgi:type II secretory pathway pseudopilin PulG
MEKRKEQNRGFTVVEMIVALSLGLLVLGLLGDLFLSQARGYKNQERKINSQQGLRASMELMVRDLRGAGYPGLSPAFLADLGHWVPNAFIPRAPLTVALGGAVTITSGGSHPDLLSLITVLSGETNPSRLAAEARTGDTRIELSLGSSEAADQFNPWDILYLGKPAEYVQVKEIRGRTLIVDSDPLQTGNQGLKNDYPAGTEVGEVSLVHYAVFNESNDPEGRYHDPGRPVLKRKVNACGFEPLAEWIEDMKITAQTPERFFLRLTARPAESGPGADGGNPHPITLATQVLKRN